MKNNRLLSLMMMVFLTVTAWTTAQAQGNNSIEGTTSDGCVASFGDEHVRIQFVNDSTVRVSKAYDTNEFNRNSYAVISGTDANISVSVTTSGDIVTLQSTKMSVTYSLSTGIVTFLDGVGHQLLTEGSHSFTSTTDGSFSSYTITQNFQLANDERIYGMGQIQDGLLNRRGTMTYLLQENCKISIPYFLSSKNYGLYWDNYSPTTFNDTGSQTYFRSTGKVIDYYVLAASNSHEVQRSLRNLTGQTELPPLWNFGAYQSKERYTSANEVMSVVQRYRDLQIPLDCVVQDWQYWGDGAHWNAMEFLNPDFSNYQQMIDFVHEKNAKIMISFWPNFGPSTTPYSDFNNRGWLFTVSDANGSRPYNTYRSDARDLYWNYVWNGIISKGIDAYWMDATEPEFFGDDEYHMNNIALDGQTWRSVRNAYPLVDVSGVAQHHRAQSELSNKRVSIMTRSAYLGQQRTGCYIWSADINGTWDALRKQIPAACSVSETGLPYWNSDTGGFFNGDVNNANWCRLFVRWTQFSTFTPMLRFHGTATPREPWQFGSAGDGRGNYDNIVKYINLRYALLPYLYSTAHLVRTDAQTFMQGMPVAFPNDAQTYNIVDQYMFGKSFLVAPVMEDGLVGRHTYLPTGERWIDFWDGYTHDGGQKVYKKTPMSIIPLYVRAGSILPWGPEVQYSSEKNWDNLELRIYPGANGKFILYEDELDGYNYENGQYSEIPMTWNDATKTLTIGARQGSFSGMLNERTFNVVVVTPDKGIGDAHTTTFDATVNYNGTEVSVVLDAENVEEPVNENVPSSEPLEYPVAKVAAQPVVELEDGVEYVFQNANETLTNRRFFWDWENLRTRSSGNIDDVKVVAEKNVVDGETYWAFRITSSDYNNRYMGRNNDRNVQVSDKVLWKVTYAESTTNEGTGFVLRIKGDTEDGLSAMMMNGDGTWVVAWQYGDPGSDYTPLSTHWQFFRTDELSSEAIQQYNDARLLLYQYLREALQQYSRDITSVIPAYNSGLAVYNDDNSTLAEINAAVVVLRAAIADAISQYQVGVPGTYGILNQGFENLSAQKDVDVNGGVKIPFGWTVTKNGYPVSSDDGTWGWSAINADGDSYMEGGHLWGVWTDGDYGNYELSQTLTNMKNGVWRVTALVLNNEVGKLGRLFLNNNSMLAGTVSDFSSLPEGEECTFSGEWSSIYTDKDMHQRFQVESVITDGTLKFGIRGNYFIKADDFQLTYLGPLTITIGSTGYATYVTPCAIDLDAISSDLIAYKVTSAAVGDYNVHLESVEGIVGAGRALIFQGNPGTYTFTRSTQSETTDLSDNLLKGSDGRIKGDGSTIYGFANKSHGVGFYLVGNDVTIPAGKAYLQIVSGSGEVKEFLPLDFWDATGIINIEQLDKLQLDNYEIYDLQGRRVKYPIKGLYIVNGKKLFIK